MLRLPAMFVGRYCVYASPFHHSRQVGLVGIFGGRWPCFVYGPATAVYLNVLGASLVRHTAPPYTPLKILRILGGVPLNVKLFSLHLAPLAFYDLHANDID